MSDFRVRSFIIFGCISLIGLYLTGIYLQRQDDAQVTHILPANSITRSKMMQSSQMSLCNNNSETSDSQQSVLKNIKNELIHLAKVIRKAKQHVRGTKTGDALIDAKKRMSAILKSLNVNFESETKRTLQKPESVCPEIYKGSLFGYYFYNKGFVVQNCSYSKALSKLVTIVILYDERQTFNVPILLRSIRKFDIKIPVIFGHMLSSATGDNLVKGFDNIKVMSFQGEHFYGKALNAMLAKVQTPYTLVARDVMWFNHDARLDRLIRQIERLNVLSAGGSFRNIKGHWFKGCQQRVYRNFTLVYEAGYDESIEECLFCDHIDGPFVSKTDQIKGKFNEKIKSEGLFEELFYKLSKSEHVVCPDSMFFTNRTERSYNGSDWKSFQTQWPLKKIKFSGTEIKLPTPSSYGCYSKGTSLTPWCQEENANVLYAAMKVCEDEKLICELESGSVMGAVKFHSVLPWERDADVMFISGNFTTLKNARPKWAKMGYRLSIENTVKCCHKHGNVNRTTGGYFGLRSKHWRLEMWGMPELMSEPMYMDNQTATLCYVDGRLVRSPRNPGLYARNRYGKEIYQHAQHWMDTGKGSSWKPYKTNRFVRCPNPGGQNCLDRYNGDGNLQFRDPIP